MQWKSKQVILYCLKNEQECIIRKTRREAESFIPADNTRLRVFFNSFKSSDINQFILALIFRFGVILV